MIYDLTEAQRANLTTALRAAARTSRDHGVILARDFAQSAALLRSSADEMDLLLAEINRARRVMLEVDQQ